jgi:hypothetical protein
MIILCPHCQGALDIADKQIGERVQHARCTYWVLVGRHADGTRYGVKVQPPITISERKRMRPSRQKAFPSSFSAVPDLVRIECHGCSSFSTSRLGRTGASTP